MENYGKPAKPDRTETDLHPLHARARCKEYDQTLAEMSVKVEEIERQYPGRKVADPFARGYRRDREYYQQLCDESKAA